MKTKRKIIIKVRLCRTGAIISFLVFLIAVITCIVPSYYPIFIFSLIDYLLVILPSIYFEKIEEVEQQNE